MISAEDQSTLSAEDKAELNAAIAQAEEALTITVSDQATIDAAEARILAILNKIGAEGYENIEPEKASPLDSVWETITCFMSKSALFILGGGSLVDRILTPVRFIIGLVSGK